jgi:hypothetical protein
MEDNIEKYNIFNTSFNKVILFKDAINSIIRICKYIFLNKFLARVLGMYKGNILLMGLGGVGKLTVSKIATYVMKN